MFIDVSRCAGWDGGGCWCLCRGEKHGNNFTYSIKNVVLRSVEGTCETYAKITNKLTTSELGINGVPKLQQLAHWNMIDRTALDVMHCVFLGVTKKLLSLWYKSSNHAKEFYIPKEKWRGMYISLHNLILSSYRYTSSKCQTS